LAIDLLQLFSPIFTNVRRNFITTLFADFYQCLAKRGDFPLK
jgi:hypothetical protein